MVILLNTHCSYKLMLKLVLVNFLTVHVLKILDPSSVLNYLAANKITDKGFIMAIYLFYEGIF